MRPGTVAESVAYEPAFRSTVSVASSDESGAAEGLQRSLSSGDEAGAILCIDDASSLALAGQMLTSAPAPAPAGASVDAQNATVRPAASDEGVMRGDSDNGLGDSTASKFIYRR